jgi:ribosomal protein S18 acetylase RimI-like enzyme
MELRLSLMNWFHSSPQNTQFWLRAIDRKEDGDDVAEKRRQRCWSVWLALPRLSWSAAAPTPAPRGKMEATVPTFRDLMINLYSRDLSQAAAFYSELGFVETFRTPASGEPVHNGTHEGWIHPRNRDHGGSSGAA